MKPKIDYPYMPSDRHLKYVPHDFPHMKEARRAQEECAGDPLFPVGIVLVKDGKVLARAGNGWNLGPQHKHVCPRVVLECKSGEGYDLCDVHDPPGHSEPMLMRVCKEKGIDPTGADAYMYGHWWACEPCWKTLIDHGVRDLFVCDDAHERFSRDKVYAKTLQPSLKNIYISESLTNIPEEIRAERYAFSEKLSEACTEIGCTAYIPHLHSDPFLHPELPDNEVFEHDCNRIWKADVLVAEVSYPSLGVGGELVTAQHAGKPIVLVSKKGTNVSRFATGNPAVVYHVQYDTYEDACRMLKNVLKQL